MSDLTDYIDIKDYLFRIVKYTKIPGEILILSLMSIDKVLKQRKDFLNKFNAHR